MVLTVPMNINFMSNMLLPRFLWCSIRQSFSKLLVIASLKTWSCCAVRRSLLIQSPLCSSWMVNSLNASETSPAPRHIGCSFLFGSLCGRLFDNQLQEQRHEGTSFLCWRKHPHGTWRHLHEWCLFGRPQECLKLLWQPKTATRQLRVHGSVHCWKSKRPIPSLWAQYGSIYSQIIHMWIHLQNLQTRLPSLGMLRVGTLQMDQNLSLPSPGVTCWHCQKLLETYVLCSSAVNGISGYERVACKKQ